jgi:hypothetical protein
MDKDGNGVLDKREFTQGMKNVGIDLDARELEKVMEYFDYNNSGYIGYNNFSDVIEERHPGSKYIQKRKRAYAIAYMESTVVIVIVIFSLNVFYRVTPFKQAQTRMEAL